MLSKMNINQKEKNIKDLEYNSILNKQNMTMVLIGTVFIYILFAENLPDGLARSDLIVLLILAWIITLRYFNRQLSKIKDEIKGL